MGKGWYLFRADAALCPPNIFCLWLVFIDVEPMDAGGLLYLVGQEAN